jgi:hypothetical protein
VSKHHKAATNPCAEVAFSDEPHPSVDLTGRYPTDASLRAHGFSIWARPSNGPPVWVRGGKQYTQAAAEKVVAMEQRYQQCPST